MVNLKVSQSVGPIFKPFFQCLGQHIFKGITNVCLQMVNCLQMVDIVFVFYVASQEKVPQFQIAASWWPVDITIPAVKRLSNVSAICRLCHKMCEKLHNPAETKHCHKKINYHGAIGVPIERNDVLKVMDSYAHQIMLNKTKFTNVLNKLGYAEPCWCFVPT